MLNVTASQLRVDIFKLLKANQPFEVKHHNNSFVVLPKREYDEMYKAMVVKEYKEAMEEASGQERYTSEEVDAMLAKVLGVTDGDMDQEGR